MHRSELPHEAPEVDGGKFPPDLHDTHHLWLKAVLLTVWVVVSFGTCFFARDLQAWGEGLSLGYWMAAQGAVLMFMLLVVIYCVVMDQFERNDTARSRAVQPGQHGRPE